MKKIKTEDAIGVELCHDITKIVKGEFKGVAFKKGHIITENDVQELLKLGKEHIFLWEENSGFLHEVDAAVELKNIVMGEGVEFSGVKEGKIEFSAKYDGLLSVDIEKLIAFNMIDDLMLSLIFDGSIVKKEQKLGATKVIPLLVSEEKIEKAKSLSNIFCVKKFIPKKTAIITTGSEVFSGRIKDGFEPVLREKLSAFNCEIISHSILPDDLQRISGEIKNVIQNGAELVLCTGGMSVDPDDLTPTAIKNAGSEIISYGAPVIPGAMFLVAYNNGIPVLGLPGSVMFAKRTVFDLILPKIVAGEIITKAKIASLSHGGFL